VSEPSRRTTVASTIGFMAGMGAMALLYHGVRWHHRRPDQDAVLRRFTREFSLRPEQQAAVKTVLDDNARRLDELHRETEGKLGEIRKSMRAQMRAALDSEQQKKFDEKAARWDAKRKPSEPNHGG